MYHPEALRIFNDMKKSVDMKNGKNVFLSAKIWELFSVIAETQKESTDHIGQALDYIHSEYMKHTINDEYRELLWNMLSRLDKRIREIEYAGKIPSVPSYPREHGHNLYKPE